MKRKKNPYFESKLDHLDHNERTKILKQASRLRKEALARGGRRASLGDLIHEVTATPGALNMPTESGTVTWIGAKSARINELEVDLNGHRAVVGDVVRYARFAEHLRIIAVEPRRTKLARPNVGNANVEQVLVANVDLVGIVVSVTSPPLHPRLIDRYLVAIQLGGAEPVLVVNKADLLDAEHLNKELEKVRPYRALGIRNVICSASSGFGIDALRASIAGKVCAFVGHSGVGKSSIVNALAPQVQAETGDLMRGYGRGAHTTTASSMFEVGNGTRLIDTPGIRSFGLGKMTLGELESAFPEFGEFSCKFRDCSHRHEPGCGVREAIQQGVMFPERYETYLRLLEEVVPGS
ncbi:MAG TPA: ribosome small subunit-dependent GTPase A [Fimbriimonadaceae bacterium]|nr:ribosome small subunit-dependent GTPase A [Fimbriimonadaceae bacterium]